MINKEDIPDMAICHKCGKPMQVVNLVSQAARLGVKVPKGAFVIECCGTELTIDDDFLAVKIRDILLAYHQQRGSDASNI